MKACLGKQNPVFGQVSYDKPLIVEVLTPRRQKQPAFWEPSSINGYESVNIICHRWNSLGLNHPH